jgi:spermidine synthase
VNAILIGVVVLLLGLGAALLLMAHVRGSIVGGLLSIGILGVIFVPAVGRDPSLYSQETQYQKVNVVDGQYDDRPARFFLQDHAPSGAVYLESDEPVFEIVKYTALYRILYPDIHRALIIGGGAYNIPKKLLQDIPNIQVDVAEIDPALQPIAERYFGLKPDSRLVNHVVDGRRFLHDTEVNYDLIYSDVYYSFSIPMHLATAEFFEVARERLNDKGFFLGNFVGRLATDEDQSFLFSEMRTFQDIFPNSYFFLTEPDHPTEGQNIIFLGYKHSALIDFNSSSFASQTDPFLRSLKSKLIDTVLLDLGRYPKLTDNYAPVEYLIGRLVARTQGTRPLSLSVQRPK